MEDASKKKISIAFAVCCLSLAIGITIKTNFSSGYSGNSEPTYVLCTNPECRQTFELSEKEFDEFINQNQNSNMPMETPVFKCTKCSQKSAYVAMKCEKCGNVFVPNYQNHDSFDKCQKCGFSKYQQESKEQK